MIIANYFISLIKILLNVCINYSKRKEYVLIKQKIIKISFIFFIGALAFFLFKPIWTTTTGQTKIVFFGLGKADSIYIENGNKNILIDTGLKEDKNQLIAKLQALRVQKIDHLILTHPDKDHIGAASYILDKFEVGELIQSNHMKDTKREARIQKVVEEKNIQNIIPTENMEFEVGNLKVTVFTPKRDDYKKDNDYSLVTLIEDGDLNYLFAGDAEEELLGETLELPLPPIDLYKAAHHGRKNSNSESFIKKLSPQYTVITNFEAAGEIDDLLNGEDSTTIYVAEKDLQFFSNGKELHYK